VVETIRKICRSDQYVCTDDRMDGMASYEELLTCSNPSEPDTAFIDEDDLVAIFYTSGTTGYPKGTMISHRNRMVDMIHQVLDYEYIEPEDIHLNIGPLYHIGALCQSHGHLYRGCTVVVLNEFDPKRVFELIETEKVKSFWGAPTMLQMLIDYPEAGNYKLDSIKTIAYAGSSMPFELLKRAIEFFGENKLIQPYGMTETGPQITHLAKRDHVLQGSEKQMKRLRSAGRESQNVHVRVVDQKTGFAFGQIRDYRKERPSWVWKKPEETKKHSPVAVSHGDMGYMDEDRYLYLVDRKKDMIITGGENVYSTEVENVLYMHPGFKPRSSVPHEK
jgi:long-chain acyl-CoA synthetase